MRVVIVGCGRLGSLLATIFVKDSHEVTIIDKNESAFSRLDDNFSGYKILGDGALIDVLKRVDSSAADLFFALTNNDNTNIMIGQIVKNKFKTK